MDNTGKLFLFGAVAVSVLFIRRAMGGAKKPPIKPLAVERQVMKHSSLIWRMGVKYDTEPALIAAIMATESSGIHQGARLIPVTLYDGSRGTDYVVGLMQVRVDTAISHCGIWNSRDLEPDAANVECGVKYLRYLLDRVTLVERAVSAYNAGPGNVSADPSDAMRYVNVDYVRKVLGMIPRFRLLFMAAQGGDAYLALFPGWKWRFETP